MQGACWVAGSPLHRRALLHLLRRLLLVALLLLRVRNRLLLRVYQVTVAPSATAARLGWMLRLVLWCMVLLLVLLLLPVLLLLLLLQRKPWHAALACVGGGVVRQCYRH